jgi:hypothetical protein
VFSAPPPFRDGPPHVPLASFLRLYGQSLLWQGQLYPKTSAPTRMSATPSVRTILSTGTHNLSCVTKRHAPFFFPGRTACHVMCVAIVVPHVTTLCMCGELHACRHVLLSRKPHYCEVYAKHLTVNTPIHTQPLCPILAYTGWSYSHHISSSAIVLNGTLHRLSSCMTRRLWSVWVGQCPLMTSDM